MPAIVDTGAVWGDVLGPVDGDDVNQTTFWTNWIVPFTGRDNWLKQAAASARVIDPGDDADDVVETVVHVQHGSQVIGESPETNTIVRFSNDLAGRRKVVMIDRLDANQLITFRNESAVIGSYVAPQPQTRLVFEFLSTSSSGAWSLVHTNALPWNRDYALVVSSSVATDRGARCLHVDADITTTFVVTLVQDSALNGGAGHFAPNELKTVYIRSMQQGTTWVMNYPTGQSVTFTADRPMRDIRLELLHYHDTLVDAPRWKIQSSSYRVETTSTLINTSAPYQIPDGRDAIANSATFEDASWTVYAPENPWVGQEVTVTVAGMTSQSSHLFRILTAPAGDAIASLSVGIGNSITDGWLRIRYFGGGVWRCTGAGRLNEA